MAVIAALDDPPRAVASGDDADVMPPHHNDADARLARIGPDGSPIARKPEIPVGHSQVLAEPPAAPRGRTARVTGIPPGAPMRVRTVVMLVRTMVNRMAAVPMMAARLGAG